MNTSKEITKQYNRVSKKLTALENYMKANNFKKSDLYRDPKKGNVIDENLTFSEMTRYMYGILNTIHWVRTVIN